MIKRNYLRMQKSFQLKYGINAKDLEKYLSIIDSESRKIIYARWGVEDGILCLNFKDLDTKLNIQNSKDAYKSAELELEKAKFAFMVKDFKDFPYKVAVNLGILGCVVSNTKECCVYGKKLIDCIGQLPIDMSRVILFKYGLISNNVSISDETLSDYDKLTLSEIKTLESFGIRRLKVLSSKFMC